MTTKTHIYAYSPYNLPYTTRTMRKTPISMGREDEFGGDMSAFVLYVWMVASASSTARTIYTNRWLTQLDVGQLVFDRVRFGRLIGRSASCALATCKRLEQKRNKIRIQSDNAKTIVTIVDYLDVVWFDFVKWQTKNSNTTDLWQTKNTKKNDKNDKNNIDNTNVLSIRINQKSENILASDVSPPTPLPPTPKKWKKKWKIDIDAIACIDIIKKYNQGTINGSKWKQYVMAKHLISKIKEMEPVQSGRYTRDSVLDMAVAVCSQSSMYAHWVTWPYEIHQRRSSICAVAKTELSKQNKSTTSDLSQYDIKNG